MKKTKVLLAGLCARPALAPWPKLARATVLGMIAGTALSAGAATALQGHLNLRSLTPGEITSYGLTNFQKSAGLHTIGVGEPAYLELLVNAAIPASQITNITWTLSGAPLGSAAALAADPLGTNVPTYKISDRIDQAGNPVYQVAGRTFLRPDMEGQFTVTAMIQTTGSGSTNLTQTITAATYMGLETCQLCHSGGLIADNVYAPWSKTEHATFFTLAIDGLESNHYGKNCISCHTVGYDANPYATNGGFDDIAAKDGWTFPSVLTNGNWAALPANLKNLSNIQCEDCHGPGSQHAHGLGDTSLITKTFDAGDCAQCHDSPNTHIKNAEWNNSLHARVTRIPTGAGREACARCHTGGGFAGYAATLGTTNAYSIVGADTTYTAITCQTCHDPHDASYAEQLRVASTSAMLADGVTLVTNAGFATICIECHRSRNGSVSNSIVNYPLGLATWAGGSSFGPHDSPVSDMVYGVNGWTYGQAIPNGAHSTSISNVCVACHMQTVAAGAPGFLKAGGHTWNMSYQAVSGGVTNNVDMVTVCQQCHGPITSFDFQVADYNGDGVIQGVQTEVKGLLNQLSMLLPNSTYQSNGNYVADGLVKSSISVKTNWPAKFLEAAYNWQFVNNDGSFGIHNTPYAVGLLKASINDLNGGANNSLPSWWQIQYFGSTTNPNAAPNATPAGDGIPNWVKFGLGLDPNVAGLVLPNGVVWANGSATITPGSTNDIQIFTAAEVVYATKAGESYQLQGISSLGAGWQNIGAPVAGDGTTRSFLTPTRNFDMQFYRVVPTP